MPKGARRPASRPVCSVRPSTIGLQASFPHVYGGMIIHSASPICVPGTVPGGDRANEDACPPGAYTLVHQFSKRGSVEPQAGFPMTLSGYPQGQSHFHDNTQMLFASFVLTFAQMAQKQCQVKWLMLGHRSEWWHPTLLPVMGGFEATHVQNGPHDVSQSQLHLRLQGNPFTVVSTCLCKRSEGWEVPAEHLCCVHHRCLGEEPRGLYFELQAQLATFSWENAVLVVVPECDLSTRMSALALRPSKGPPGPGSWGPRRTGQRRVGESRPRSPVSLGGSSPPGTCALVGNTG